MNSQNTINRRCFLICHSISFAISSRSPASTGAAGDGGQSGLSGKDGSGIHCLCQSHPGKINMASAGVGGPQHVAGELFKYMAGVDLVHVPITARRPRWPI